VAPTPTLRPARESDLSAVVDIHVRAFPGFFLTSLGRHFLLELYRGFLTRESGRLLVSEVQGRVAGFTAGTLSPEQFFRQLLLARWFAFAAAAMGATLLRPRVVVPRLLSALRYRGERPPMLTDAALLSAIAVDPHRGGTGIGTILVDGFCREAAQSGLRFIYLTTDRDDNEATRRFYARQGFHADSEIRRRDGRVMVRYVRELLSVQP
jgi:ribosomal protein S18 acetylase RimI-like enzyme